MSFGQLLLVLRARKLLILSIIAVIFLGALGVSWILPPR